MEDYGRISVQQNRKLVNKRPFLNTNKVFSKKAYQRKKTKNSSSMYERKEFIKRANLDAIIEICGITIVLSMLLILVYFVC